ncbi:MAG TPA: hypothetical protein VMH22_10515 [bacterium]|nr:hypothetical protein [bacterium]
MFRHRHLLLIPLLAVLSPAAGSWLNNPDNSYEVRFSAEAGLIGALKNTIQFGKQGTQFNYVADGGQDILFPFRRMSAELHLKPRHTIILLYQPIDLRTETYLTKPLVVDTDTFPAGTPMDLRYGFDFYRISYQYDFWPQPDRELAVGLSLQVRDAAISFATKDGSRVRVYDDVGPVPILRFRGRLPLAGKSWAGAEVDGFYAQGKVVTGSTNVQSAFRGAILDASLRYGLSLNQSVDAFVNLRYIGGGASGQQNVPQYRGDGYTDNWLGTVDFGIGLYLK